MSFSLESKTVADCISYMKIIYKNNHYTLDEFSKQFKNGEFQLEPLLNECTLLYREKELSFDDYRKQIRELSDILKFSKLYSTSIISIEPYLAICNYDFYKAAKFLEKAESCLQTARFYLIKSANILEYDAVLPWKYGYQPIFDIRATNFTTAVIWYNNCFDYILQIASLAFELYKKMPKYQDTMTFEDVLKSCTYKNIRNIHNNNPNNTALNELWQIVDECHTAISDVNNWANYAKHKGGIGIIGLKPGSPYKIYIGKPGEEPESRTDEFEPIKLDLDDSIQKMRGIHEALLSCISKLVDFIDFSKAKYTINAEGQFVIPSKDTYVKINL